MLSHAREDKAIGLEPNVHELKTKYRKNSTQKVPLKEKCCI